MFSGFKVVQHRASGQRMIWLDFNESVAGMCLRQTPIEAQSPCSPEVARLAGRRLRGESVSPRGLETSSVPSCRPIQKHGLKRGTLFQLVAGSGEGQNTSLSFGHNACGEERGHVSNQTHGLPGKERRCTVWRSAPHDGINDAHRRRLALAVTVRRQAHVLPSDFQRRV
jgi:hypothetical protein